MNFFGHIRPDARHLAVRRFGGVRAFYDSDDSTIRVAHITDQHVGPVTPASLQKAAIGAVNAANPDIVVLTGDYIAYGLDYLEQVREYLAGIHAPTWAVLGNHDHWSGAEEVRRVLSDAGAEVLDNAWTSVEVRGRTIQIVGIDDAVTGHDDIDAATSGLDRSVATIGLSHSAESADELWEHGVEFVMSGHTHSGQFAVARIPELLLGRLAGHRYIHGLYGCRHQESHPGAVYVSAGIGSSRVSLRFGDRARPELAIFDLHTHPNTIDEHHTEQPQIQRIAR